MVQVEFVCSVEIVVFKEEDVGVEVFMVGVVVVVEVEIVSQVLDEEGVFVSQVLDEEDMFVIDIYF